MMASIGVFVRETAQQGIRIFDPAEIRTDGYIFYRTMVLVIAFPGIPWTFCLWPGNLVTGVARSISMFAPASLFIAPSTILSRLSIILPVCSNAVNPHRKDVQRYRRNPPPASQPQVSLRCDLSACAPARVFSITPSARAFNMRLLVAVQIMK